MLFYQCPSNLHIWHDTYNYCIKWQTGLRKTDIQSSDRCNLRRVTFDFFQKQCLTAIFAIRRGYHACNNMLHYKVHYISMYNLPQIIIAENDEQFWEKPRYNHQTGVIWGGLPLTIVSKNDAWLRFLPLTEASMHVTICYTMKSTTISCITCHR